MTWPIPVNVSSKENTVFWSPDRPCSVAGFKFNKPTKLLEVKHGPFIKAIQGREIPPEATDVQSLHDVSRLAWGITFPFKIRPGEIISIKFQKVANGVTVELMILEEVVDGVRFKCPGCGVMVTVEGGSASAPVFMHPMPTCERFDRCEDTNDLTEILREARLKAQAGVS